MGCIGIKILKNGFFWKKEKGVMLCMVGSKGRLYN